MSADAESPEAGRLAREQAFHDSRYAGHSRAGIDSYYSLLTAGADHYEMTVRSQCRGRRVLEYGCGEGRFALSLASEGAAAVEAIDISEVAIAAATRNAGAENAVVTFRQMNAERLEYEDDAFDLICGRSILHHLDLERALTEISRTLRSGGRAVFLEPLGHNPILNLVRRLTPHLRSADEHPLLNGDIRAAGRYFDSVQARYFHLSSLLAVPFRRVGGVGRMVAALDRLDTLLFATPLRAYAWVVVLTLSQPRKSHGRKSRGAT